MNAKKLLWVWPVGFVVSLYTAFVLQNLWNWFGVAPFHFSNISFWEMYGLVLFAGLLVDRSSVEFGHDQRWKGVLIVLDACLPEDNKGAVEEKLERQAEQMWAELGWLVFGKLVGNTVTLAVGWGIHAFVV